MEERQRSLAVVGIVRDLGVRAGVVQLSQQLDLETIEVESKAVLTELIIRSAGQIAAIVVDTEFCRRGPEVLYHVLGAGPWHPFLSQTEEASKSRHALCNHNVIICYQGEGRGPRGEEILGPAPDSGGRRFTDVRRVASEMPNEQFLEILRSLADAHRRQMAKR